MKTYKNLNLKTTKVHGIYVCQIMFENIILKVVSNVKEAKKAIDNGNITPIYC